MTVSKAEPRFDLDLKYGQQGERQIAEFLDWIVSENPHVEVKRKRYLDHRIYVETHCDRGRTGHYVPSGINGTSAAVWVFVLGDTGIHIAVPTELLRGVLDDPSTQDREETDGACPTRGKLVDFCVLLYRLKQRLTPSVETPATPDVSVDPDMAAFVDAIREDAEKKAS